MPSPTALELLVDRTAVVDTIVRFANAFDRKDWAALRACLASELFVDYSALRGEPPGVISADAYVAARRDGLTGLETQHLTSNHEVTVSADRRQAECFSAYVIHRVAPGAPAGADYFDTAGHYRHGLTRAGGPDGAWVIARITQTVLWRRGVPGLHGALGDRDPGR